MNINTVTGPIECSQLGKALVHEHILVDWIGADQAGPHRYKSDEVVSVMKPYLRALTQLGYDSFFDCSPAYLGRDPMLLKTLSESTGIKIITNTGFYKEPFLPQWAFDASPERLAELWTREFREGIDGTGIYPGFIKIAVHPGPLQVMQKKIVIAAGLTSLATGLTIASHTGSGPAAKEQLDLLERLGVPLERFIFVHADAEENLEYHLEVFHRGAWLEYDSIGGRSIHEHLKLLDWAKNNGLLSRILISHDAGWYNVGQQDGGNIRPYNAIETELRPLLLKQDVLTENEIRQLMVMNPARAYCN